VNLTEEESLLIADEWVSHAHPPQYPLQLPKPIWLMLGGRGSGKTRLGAEWVNALVRRIPPFTLTRYGRIALVGETLGDVREVMIEGRSGIIPVSRHDRPRYEATRRRLVWGNGAVAQAFSSEDPDSLRGPQFEAAWGDEVAKWKNGEATFDMLQFGLRLGVRPCQLLTTTPRPTVLMHRLLADASVTVTRMTTQANAANLAAGFLERMRITYGGTRLGRQELDGELIEDREDALWSRGLIEAAAACSPALPIGRIVIAVDPPAGSGPRADACGIVAAGLDAEGRGVVLADHSLSGARPDVWAARAVALYHALEADLILAEANQGGEMVAAVIASVDARAPVRMVRAKRGKWLRAEPVAALYAQGRVLHAGRFPQLEDEMCDFGPDGLSDGRSPDRLDALVWAIAELMLGPRREPRIRSI
jgi:phage terminase large subunit-like protein